MTVGPLVAAVGMALFIRVHEGAGYASAILPAAVVFGMGMVLTVPALTMTALGAVGPERSGIASAVNNDVARVASLAAIAVVPALAGIAGHSIGAAELSSGFRTAMLICAGLCAAGGVVSFVAVPSRRRAKAVASCVSCPVSGPPVSQGAAGGDSRAEAAVSA